MTRIIQVVGLILPLLGSAACGKDPSAFDPDAAGDSDAGLEPLFDTAEGSIFVFENTATDGTPSSSARAFFYDGVNPSAIFHVETMREGYCRLLTHEVGFCDPDCDMDELCSHEDICEKLWLTLQSAGTIDIAGLTTPVTLTPSGGWYSVDQPSLPQDLFHAGDPISATGPGDEFAGFEVSTSGVSPADLALGGTQQDELRLVDGDDFAITWPQAEPGSRIHLRLFSPASWHGLPSRRIIECDAPDIGSLIIAQTLVEAFPEQARDELCHGYQCDVSMFPRSTLLRYRRGTVTTEDGVVEMMVGSQRLFYLLHEVH